MNVPADAPPRGDCGGVAHLDRDLSTAAPCPYMDRALELAEQGRGRVEPNPVVGAVLVRDGRVVGEGFHARFGGPHAEVEAIRAAGAAARGATLYVTLEPCNHVGKTPPCVDAILAAGIARVYVAIRDPHGIASGGAERLRSSGVPVEMGLRAAEARAQNAPFLKRVTLGLPFVTIKWAMSLDGKIATSSGDARWITSEEARREAHRMRDRADAVLVGIGTVLADDPELTTRLEGGRSPLRVVVDSCARTPLGSKLVRSAREGPPVVIAVSRAASEGRVRALREAGAEVLVACARETQSERRVDLEELARALAARADRPVTNLLVEGGGRVHASFLESGLADRVAVFVAPKIVGGAGAPAPVGGAGCARMAQALAVSSPLRARFLGPDILLEGEIGTFARAPEVAGSGFEIARRAREPHRLPGPSR